MAAVPPQSPKTFFYVQKIFTILTFDVNSFFAIKNFGHRNIFSRSGGGPKAKKYFSMSVKF